MLKPTDFVDHTGEANILHHVEAALDRAREVNAAREGAGLEVAEEMRSRFL